MQRWKLQKQTKLYRWESMTPQHFHTIPTSCAILLPLTQTCYVSVVKDMQYITSVSGLYSALVLLYTQYSALVLLYTQYSAVYSIPCYFIQQQPHSQAFLASNFKSLKVKLEAELKHLERRQAFQCMHCAQLEQNVQLYRTWMQLRYIYQYDIYIYQDNPAVIITSVGLALTSFG